MSQVCEVLKVQNVMTSLSVSRCCCQCDLVIMHNHGRGVEDAREAVRCLYEAALQCDVGGLCNMAIAHYEVRGVLKSPYA